MNKNFYWYKKGIKDGIPICLGYFAVSFTLGIAAKNAGLTGLQAAIASITNMASAGEFAGFTLIAALATYAEMAITIFIINARYLLMSCSLSQKIPADTPLWKRLVMGLTITDEIFAISAAVPEKLNIFYPFGAYCIAAPGWTLGTYLGVLMGNLLPGRVVSALSVGLYGMFLAIIIPPARKSKVIFAIVILSMILSCVFTYLPVVSKISSGMRIIILTVVISLCAALIFPVKEEA